jgi:hypothetical protein
VNRRGFVGEEACCAAGEAGPARVGLGADQTGGGKQVVAADEDGLDGAVVRAVVGERPLTGGFEPPGAVLGLQVKDALRGAQPLGDAVRQEALDEPGTGRPDTGGLLQTPGAIMGEEAAGDGP